MTHTEPETKRPIKIRPPKPNGNGVRPGVEDGATRSPRNPRKQEGGRLSMLREKTPEVGMDGYRETMDAVGRLAGRVAHHLNNLLTVVEGNTAYLEEALGDQRLALEVQEIRSVCRRTAGITTQLLSLSGYRWCEPRMLDLRTLVSSMDLGTFFRGDVVFCTDFASVACPVRVDPAHLEEVVLGLVLNARDAVDSRGTVRVGIDHLPWIKVDGGPVEGWVQLEVSDSGEGMDEETLQRIFQPYFSTHSFSEDRGLGLSVACGIVRQGGGTIKVFSAPGRGTTVRVWLPAVAPDSGSNGGSGRRHDPEA
jgi:two-component system, cell cycle sensor histidine kinase and response regulator CckA